MGESAFRSEEKTGLLVALILHLALFAGLFVQGLLPAPTFEPVERMTVSLAEDVGLEATAPEPVPESRAATAPTLSDSPAPPTVEPAAPPVPRQVAPPVPRVQSPVPAPRIQPREAPRREQQRTQTQPRSSERSGGSRLGDNFLDGAGTSTTTSETRVPASQIGASAKASIVQAIARQVRPHWQGKAPSGADAELLVSVLAFDLNPDGSLAGRPRVVSQEGVTPANEAQKGRHAEVAIRAVQLAAPFDLPPEYYNAWKSIRGARFDRNLSR